MGRGALAWLGVTLLLTLGACHGPRTPTGDIAPAPPRHEADARDTPERNAADHAPGAPDEDPASEEREATRDQQESGALAEARDGDALENRSDIDTDDIEPTPSAPTTTEVTLPPPATSWPAAFKRSSWPHAPWVRARAYTYNFRPYGPGPMLRVYEDGRWSDTLRHAVALNPSQAAAALELTHRTRGEAHISNCPFPRHAVVFFDEADQPVASVSVCFACGDILVWPPYFPNDRLEDRKHALGGPGELTRVGAAQEEVMPLWQQLFDGAGTARYTGPLH